MSINKRYQKHKQVNNKLSNGQVYCKKNDRIEFVELNKMDIQFDGEMYVFEDLLNKIVKDTQYRLNKANKLYKQYIEDNNAFMLEVRDKLAINEEYSAEFNRLQESNRRTLEQIQKELDEEEVV